MTGSRGVILTGSSADQGSVPIELHLGGVAVDPDGGFAAVGQHVTFIPGGDQVEGGGVLVPLAAVEVIGVLGEAGGLHDAEIAAVGDCTAVAHTAGTGAVQGSGLADVVEAGPDEFTGHAVILIGVVYGIMGGGAPTHCGSVVRGQVVLPICIGIIRLRAVNPAAVGGRGGLGGDDDAAAVVLGQAVELGRRIGVVEAHNAAIISNGIENRHQPRITASVVVAAGGGAGTVHLINPINQIFRDGGIAVHILPEGSLLDLVAQRPEDHGGIAAVPLDHSFGRNLGPSHGTVGSVGAVRGTDFEIPAEVIGVSVLGIDPAVKEFLDHQQAQFVADVDEVLVGGVVAGADGVDAHVLHDGELAVHGVIVGGGAQSALVVVEADAVELDILPVEMESGAVKAEIAEAEGGLHGIHHLSADGELGADGVQVGVVHRPELRTGYHRAGRGGHRLAGIDCDGSAGCIIRLNHRVGHGHLHGRIAVVDHVGLHLYGAVSGADIRRGDIVALVVHVDGVGDDQSDVTVDAAAGVPAAGGDIVHGLDGDDIVGDAVAGEIVGDVKGKGGIAVVVFADKGPVDIDVGIGIDAVELE